MDSDRKAHGKVYTPPEVADLMLDMAFARWDGGRRTFCDPACGDGAFLAPLAERILSRHGSGAEGAALLRGIAGFDRDAEALAACRERLDAACRRFGAEPPEWNLRLMDALDEGAWREWSGRFDFVVGNPPYVRVQNLEAGRRARIREGSWECMGSAPDLYMLFIEAGLRLLSAGGVLVYIAPSGWMKSAAGEPLRAAVMRRRSVLSVRDFGHHQVFPDATAYTAIVEIGREPGDNGAIPVLAHTGRGMEFEGGRTVVSERVGAPWTFQTPDDVRHFGERVHWPRLDEVADIHVGIQTLADGVFIMTEDRARERGIEEGALRPVAKASRIGCGDPPQVAVFPYSDSGELIPLNRFEREFPKAHAHLARSRERLLARDKGAVPSDQWHAYGRQVGLTNGFGERFLTAGMNAKPSFRRCADPRALFYSGYCVKPKRGVDAERLLDALNGPGMERHVRVHSRPFRGGWWSYSKSAISGFRVDPSIAGQAGLPLLGEAA